MVPTKSTEFGYFQTAFPCPKCGAKRAYAVTKMVNWKGEIAGLPSWKCDGCGAEPSDEEVIKDHEKWLEEIDELNS